MEKKKLSEFLKENGAYESFIENCLKDMITIIACNGYKLSNIGFIDGFNWNTTPEGIDYWEKLFYKKGEEGGIIYDMDEILYKEYEKRNNTIIPEYRTEDTKQEFQTITLNGIPYHLVPTDISDEFKDMIKKASKEDLVEETIKEILKRKFEENKGQYEVLFKEKKSNDWSFCYRPNDLSWRKDWDYKLIKKEHKEIIEAYLKDKNVKIEFTNYEVKDADIKTIWYIEEDFIKNYNEDYCYRISKKEFEPFELKLQVNTLDEAKSLWNRFNISEPNICKALESFFDIETNKRFDDYTLWEHLDKILEELDVKKERIEDFGKEN